MTEERLSLLELAELAYIAYAKRAKVHPQWDDLSANKRAAWGKAVQAVWAVLEEQNGVPSPTDEGTKR